MNEAYPQGQPDIDRTRWVEIWVDYGGNSRDPSHVSYESSNDIQGQGPTKVKNHPRLMTLKFVRIPYQRFRKIDHLNIFFGG